MGLRSTGTRFGGILAVCGAAILMAGSAVVIAQPAGEPKPAPTQPEGAPPQGQPGQRRGPGGPGGPGGGAREFTNVESAMKGLRQGMRMLRDTAGDPARKEEALQAVALMEKACLAAKTFKPEEMKPGTSIDDYRKSQIELMGMLLQLETAVIDGKSDQAKEIAQKLGKFRDEAHEKFGVKEEDRRGPGGPPPQPNTR